MVPLELDARFTFDAFIVGAGNRLAAAAARRVAESPGQTYNPLFVYSSSGLGKTHLLMAVGNEGGRAPCPAPANEKRGPPRVDGRRGSRNR